MGLFFNFFFDSSLLVYRDATDFCISLFYLETLLNVFNISNCFLVESLAFTVYNIMTSSDRDNFTFCFPIWMSFFLFFFLPDCLG